LGLTDIFRRDRVQPAALEERGQVLHDSGATSISEVLNAAPMSEGVTALEAMGLTGVWAAVNFLSAAMADVPIEVYDGPAKKGGVAKKVTTGPAVLLSGAVNDTTTSVDWREVFFSEVFGNPGRAYSYIERNARGEPVNIFHLEANRVTVRRTEDGSIFYDYAAAGGRKITYPAGDVIDLAFLRKPDMLSSWSPVQTCRGAIRQELNAQKYALTVFGKNGVPPYTLKGAFNSAKAAMVAAADVMKVARRSAEEGKPILPLPAGTDLQRLGDDPTKMQLTEVRRFGVEQAARIYSLPPMFLQDLSKGTFANTEQQDLHLVKHTLRRWVKKFEAELSLKLFGRNARRYVKLNLEGLLRGDFKTRMEGIAKAVQNGLMTPNEGRALEGREPLEGGDDLMIQGATVPIKLLIKQITAAMEKAKT